MSAALEIIEQPEQARSVLDPMRRELLDALAEPDSAAGLARRLGMPRQVITYHVRQLEAEGLVSFVAERRKRNCVERIVQATARSYVISPAALGPLGADPAHIDRAEDQFSSTYLLAVASKLIRDVGTLRRRADASRKRLATMTAQADVRFASPADQHAFAAELTECLGRLAAKYHQPEASHGRSFSFVIAGHPTLG
ncbi:MAG TPA: helix-turn-helix domain-containing protein [Gemmatimonadaceae bacterium]|nr:helix-turn-helix domain-containing protein [Gemmatimonadaceae bacterium]